MTGNAYATIALAPHHFNRRRKILVPVVSGINVGDALQWRSGDEL